MQMNSQTLTGKVALVTGAAGWIGAAIARNLAAAGAKVIVSYQRSEAGAQKTVASIEAAGGEAHAIKADITDEASVHTLVDQAQKLAGPVQILVNNALNSSVHGVPIEEQTWQKHYLGHLDLCVKAPLFLLKATLANMKASKFGRVVNIGTEQFDLADPKGAAYVAAKGAMLGLTRSWANELGPFGITVNTVAPGWIAREGHGFENGQPGAGLSGYIGTLPVGRVGVPDEVGAVVAFLCTESAAFITGQRIAVNGGRTLL
jgi:3-oxoacyl-[acyl-carrier protein] reductase